MGKKGFTITELLVTIFIVGVVFSAAYITYIKLLKGFKSESEKISSQIENLVGLEILRLDLEHVGYGIPYNETKPVLEWNSTAKSLILRSTLNNTKQSTKGYAILKCNSGSFNISLDAREDSSANMTIITTENREFFDIASVSGSSIITSNTCSNGKVYIGFPLRNEVYSGSANDCDISRCERITYLLSNSSLIDRCNPNTFNLLRRVGVSSTGGEPVLNCVADWTITFDIDSNGNGVIDSGEENQQTLPSTNLEIRSKLKAINIYILVQEGRKDPEYTYSQATTCGSDKCVVVNGELLKLPSNYENYRWKPLIIKVKPMDL